MVNESSLRKQDGYLPALPSMAFPMLETLRLELQARRATNDFYGAVIDRLDGHGFLNLMNPRKVIIDSTTVCHPPDEIHLYDDSLGTAMSKWTNLQEVEFLGPTVIVRRHQSPMPGTTSLASGHWHMFFTRVAGVPLEAWKRPLTFTWKVSEFRVNCLATELVGSGFFYWKAPDYWTSRFVQVGGKEGLLKRLFLRYPEFKDMVKP